MSISLIYIIQKIVVIFIYFSSIVVVYFMFVHPRIFEFNLCYFCTLFLERRPPWQNDRMTEWQALPTGRPGPPNARTKYPYVDGPHRFAVPWAASCSPTAPLGGDWEGIPPRHRGLAGAARLRRRPILWTPPRCLTDRRELHWWLAVTDNPPIEPIPVRHHLHSLGPPGQNSGSHLD